MQNQIQELRKDTLKARRGQTLNLGQSNINAADLAQVSLFVIEFSPHYSVGFNLCNCEVEISFSDTFTKYSEIQLNSLLVSLKLRFLHF